MTHLAIDLALGTTGYCFGPAFDDYDVLKCPAKLRGGERLDWWYESFRVLLSTPVDAVVVEAPFLHPKHPTGSVSTIELHGLVRWLFFHERLSYIAVPPSTLKQWATGRGNASKELMMACAQERGWKGDDDNEADAFLLWHYCDSFDAVVTA